MITEHNAEAQVTAAELRPDSDPSIENQNGRTSLVGGTSPVSKMENVNGATLLNELESLLTRFVILPEFAAETLALWILHTYAFELRDVSTYLGIESPEKRCGKTTLLSVLSRLANRPVAAANISPSAFFRVIEEMRPTLLIDEADTFLRGNDEIRGILNAGYTRDTAYVVRVTQADADSRSGGRSAARPGPQQQRLRPSDSDDLQRPVTIQPAAARDLPRSVGSSLLRFSCWCPKVMAAIGRLPDTLADRCIVIRMERKTIHEDCERLRYFETSNLQERCAQFVSQNRAAIASAEPEIPESLHDRAADIWEPLLVLADLAGSDWPAKSRRAAAGLTDNAQGRNPVGSLLFDILRSLLAINSDRISSRDLVYWLNQFSDRPWQDLPGLRLVDSGRRKEVTELWLAQQLRPYGIRPGTIRIGDKTPKGYTEAEMLDAFQRYIPYSEVEAFKAELKRRQTERASSPHTPPKQQHFSQP